MFENSAAPRRNPFGAIGFTKMFAMEFSTINHASEGDPRWAKTPFRTKTGLFKRFLAPTAEDAESENPGVRPLRVPSAAVMVAG